MSKRSARSYAKILSSAISGVEDAVQTERVLKAFVGLLVKDKSVYMAEKILEQFEIVQKKMSGTITGTLHLRNVKEVEKVKQSLSAALNKKIEALVVEDSSVVAGGKLITEDTIFDATFSGQIEMIRKAFVK